MPFPTQPSVETCGRERHGRKLFDLDANKLYVCNGARWALVGSSAAQAEAAAGDAAGAGRPPGHCDEGWSAYTVQSHPHPNPHAHQSPQAPRCLCYRFFNELKYWGWAQQTCAREFGGNLTSVHSLAQLDWLWASVARRSEFWFGLNARDDLLRWTYVDGHPVGYRNWAPEALLESESALHPQAARSEPMSIGNRTLAQSSARTSRQAQPAISDGSSASAEEQDTESDARRCAYVNDRMSWEKSLCPTPRHFICQIACHPDR